MNKKFIPPSFEEIINIAIKLHLRGNIQEASKYYKYCIENNINDSRILCNYGLILRNSGDLNNAQLMFEKSIKIFPKDISSYNNLSGILKELGKYN